MERDGVSDALLKLFAWTLGPIVLLVAVGMFPDRPEPVHVQRTKHTMLITISGCGSFFVEYGALPRTTTNRELNHILLGDNPRGITFVEWGRRHTNSVGEIIDAWNTPLRITFPTTNSVQVESAGKDRLFSTKDDIVSER
jgi:hypothetical protein